MPWKTQLRPNLNRKVGSARRTQIIYLGNFKEEHTNTYLLYLSLPWDLWFRREVHYTRTRIYDYWVKIKVIVFFFSLNKANLVDKIGDDANNSIEEQRKKVEALASKADVAEDNASKLVDKIGEYQLF